VPNPSFDLYLVTDRTQTRGRDLLWVLEQALEGGVNAVQLREKNLSGRDLLELAEKTRALCERYSAPLFINDRVDVALAVNAAGVQLGKASFPIEVARTLLGRGKLIGASVHSPEEVTYAKSAGADFVVFGPIYFTTSKAQFGVPQGLSALRKIVEVSMLPVYAIGGITSQNTAEVRDAGANGIALISGIIAAENPKEAAAGIAQLLRN
jgi:thiamine-phosphate pyrophosphorylase